MCLPLFVLFLFAPFVAYLPRHIRWGGHRVLEGNDNFDRMLKSLMAVMMASQVRRVRMKMNSEFACFFHVVVFVFCCCNFVIPTVILNDQQVCRMCMCYSFQVFCCILRSEAGNMVKYQPIPVGIAPVFAFPYEVVALQIRKE